MLAVVSPVLQRYVLPPEAVREAEVPAQIVPALPLIEMTGKEFTVTKEAADPEHPPELVPVTV